MQSTRKRKRPRAARIQLQDYDDWLSLYLRLARIFRHRIRTGAWKPGERIPTIPELCEEFGASRTPVRQAIALLVQDGIITTARRRGTFVSDRLALSIDDDSLRISISDPLVLGQGQTFKVLKRTAVDRPPDELSLDCPHYASYVAATKTHAHESTTFAVMDIYVAEKFYRKFPRRADEKHKTVHLLRSHTNVKPVLYRQEITIVHASEDIARLLKVAIASVVVRVRRWWVDNTGKVAWCSLAFYRADMFVMDLAMEDADGKAFGLRAVAPAASRSLR